MGKHPCRSRRAGNEQGNMILRSSPENLRIVVAALAKRMYVDESEGKDNRWHTTPMIVN